jgi:carbamoyl-phosphate synthase large subunit
VDGVANKGEIVIEAIAEHVENAGVHSGDATIVIPPQRLYLETIRRTKKITSEIVRALQISGPFNIQFIAKNNNIQVIECNLRAARSFPFVSKVTGYNFIAIATRVILGMHVPINYETLELDYVAVKVPQFSYSRLKGSNPVANVEMASTGEVACIGEDMYEAYLRAWLSADQPLPEKKQLLVSISDNYKGRLLPLLKQLDEQGWTLYSTAGTHEFLSKNGIGSYFACKASEKQEPNIQTLISTRKIDLIINIPTTNKINTQTDGYVIRRMAVDHHIPIITNVQIALIMLQCLINFKGKPPENVLSWQEYIKRHMRKLPVKEAMT